MAVDSTIRDSVVARSQLLICAMIAILFASAITLAQVMVRNDQMLLPNRLAQWKQASQTYLDRRFYANAAERQLYNVLPDADFSRGTVCFIGSSPMQQAVMSWEFPTDLQPLIHNFCFAGSRHTTQYQFVRSLVNDHRILDSSGAKTLVVLELTFASAVHDPTPLQTYMDQVWQGYFTRYGIYGFDPTSGLHLIPMSPLMRRFKIESIRTHAFWSWVLRHDNSYLNPASTASVAQMRQTWMDRMGPGWEAGVDAEVQQVGAMIDYLRARHAEVSTVYFPQQTWVNDFPPAQHYRQQMMTLLARKSVPVLDLIHQFPDRDFVDSVHLNYDGTAKIQPPLIDLAQKHFQSHLF